MKWTDEIEKRLQQNKGSPPDSAVAQGQDATPSRAKAKSWGCVKVSTSVLIITTIIGFYKGWPESTKFSLGFSVAFFLVGFAADSFSHKGRGCLAVLLLIIWIFMGVGMIILLFSAAN